jgi:hypothetical protein
MQAEEDVARAKEAEAAFHARLAAATHEMETNPNPWERRGAAHIVSEMTCNYVRAPSFPDDHLWLGNWRARHTPELDKYIKRCRRLWREHAGGESLPRRYVGPED